MSGWSFFVLSCVAVAGAVGVLLCRRSGDCLFSFLTCSGAIGGLLLLLDLPVVAAVQVTLCVLMVGVGFALLPDGEALVKGRSAWLLVAGALGVLLMWNVARGAIGEPVPGAPPMWAVREGRLIALGEEWGARHAVLLPLLGILLLAGIVGAAHIVGRGQD